MRDLANHDQALHGFQQLEKQL